MVMSINGKAAVVFGPEDFAQLVGQYIWITRTCGTYLVPVGIAATDPDRSAELLAAIRRTWSDAERREYCITLGPCSHSFQPLRQREARA